ncbi:hypothetical protein OOT33_17245 [Sphingobium sp. DEHP117]|uniref:hypothetical protein n=1 Tax=Sphingobium sp. DEHP117 TaxID=2993436 RepID=UPI0027D50EC8|nr:hypothetical protein [Sphingobium sp. DEHP117]MDQ4422158.1 hypothetical protein [Sphingobium sp. DEHP117]
MIQPSAVACKLVNADRAWFDRPCRKARQDHRDMSRARHHRIGLVGRRLAAAAGMDMDVRNNTIAAFAA